MQGYNDRLDESLGMRDGVEPMMMQSYKDRRDESKGMEKAMGRRAYQSVGTMDKMGMGGYLLAGGTGAYLGAKYPDKVKKVTDPLDKAVEDINRNLRNRYEDGGVVVGGSTVLRDNGDIMPLGTANADAVFQTGGVTAQTVVNPNEAMADLQSTYGFDDVYAKGGELQSAEISRLRKNIMGTLSFDLKVGSMRKAQDFIVYPMSELEDKISIQSSKKFGIISIEDGRGILSKGSGNTFMHLRRDMAMRNVITFKLTSSQLEELKNEIRKTGGSKVGNSVIFSDNSGASLLAKGGEIKIRNGKVVKTDIIHEKESLGLPFRIVYSNFKSKWYFWIIFVIGRFTWTWNYCVKWVGEK